MGISSADPTKVAENICRDCPWSASVWKWGTVWEKRATCGKNIPIKMHRPLLFKLPSDLTAPRMHRGLQVVEQA